MSHMRGLVGYDPIERRDYLCVGEIELGRSEGCLCLLDYRPIVTLVILADLLT